MCAVLFSLSKIKEELEGKAFLLHRIPMPNGIRNRRLKKAFTFTPNSDAKLYPKTVDLKYKYKECPTSLIINGAIGLHKSDSGFSRTCANAACPPNASALVAQFQLEHRLEMCAVLFYFIC
jgi:hypothetical protein